MTKKEHMKCEKVMYTAIQKIKQANEEYSEAEMVCNTQMARQISLRKADQHYGEAMGIHQTLVAIGFKQVINEIKSKN